MAEDTETQIEELKQLVRRSIALSEDTNRIVHKMHRSSIWATIFRVVWWLTILGITGAIYYYVLGPYVSSIFGLYEKAQQAAQSIPGR